MSQNKTKNQPPQKEVFLSLFQKESLPLVDFCQPLKKNFEDFKHSA
jgi:hypothetical protein